MEVCADALVFTGSDSRTLGESCHLSESQPSASRGTPDGDGIAGRWHLILGYCRVGLKPGHKSLWGRTQSEAQDHARVQAGSQKPPFLSRKAPEGGGGDAWAQHSHIWILNSLLKGLILREVEECWREAEHEIGNPEWPFLYQLRKLLWFFHWESLLSLLYSYLRDHHTHTRLPAELRKHSPVCIVLIRKFRLLPAGCLFHETWGTGVFERPV